MKKCRGWLVILGLACLLEGTLANAAGARTVASNLQGSATVTRDGQAQPVAVGTAFGKKDVIRTGPDCTLDLAMNDVAGCRLLAASECTLMRTGKRNMHVNVTNGNAILNLKKLSPGSTFKVETPTAVAAVRGTQFWGRVGNDAANNPVTTFAVRTGAVEVLAKTSGATFTLKEGQALDIPKDTALPPAVRPALAEEMAAMEQASSIKTSA